MVEKKIFGKWRQRLWPVQLFELKKLIPLLFLKFFINCNYTILTTLKDTLIITEKGSGAEVIPVLKGGLVLPFAVIVTLIYSKLVNRFRRETLFYGIVLSFLTFVLFYAYILYPNKELFSPNQSADWLLSVIGQKYSHWISLYRNWMQSLFFVFTELWGGVGIFILFWGFVNQITLLDEAKRFYTLFIAVGDIALLAIGPVISYHSLQSTNFVLSIQTLSNYIFVFSFLIMGLHWWLHHYVLKDKKFYDPSKINATEETTKLSLIDSLKFIASSKYLRYLAIMVVSYGFTINLIEVSWKANLKLLYPNSAEYNAFYSNVLSAVGFFSLLVSFFFSGGIIRWLGWHFSAQIAPIVVGSSGLIFLLLLIAKDFLTPITALLGVSPLLIIVFYGAFQNVLSKVVKYCFFDPTKEMAFIPLDQESKIKGKAAVDVIAARFGKSGAAWVQLAFIEIGGTGSLLSVTPYLIPFLTATLLFWIYSVFSLQKRFMKKTEGLPENPAF